MLDIKVIRNETERVKAAMARRKENIDIDAVLALDASFCLKLKVLKQSKTR